MLYCCNINVSASVLPLSFHLRHRAHLRPVSTYVALPLRCIFAKQKRLKPHDGVRAEVGFSYIHILYFALHQNGARMLCLGT